MNNINGTGALENLEDINELDILKCRDKKKIKEWLDKDIKDYCPKYLQLRKIFSQPRERRDYTAVYNIMHPLSGFEYTKLVTTLAVDISNLANYCSDISDVTNDDKHYQEFIARRELSFFIHSYSPRKMLYYDVKNKEELIYYFNYINYFFSEAGTLGYLPKN